MKKLLSLFAFAILLTSCGGNDKVVLRKSIGKVNKVMVVTKASDWNGDIGKAIRNSFGELMVGLPQPESLLSVSQVAPNGFGTMMKVGRNILVIGNGDKEEYFVRHNVYAQPQTVVYVYAKDDEGVVKMFNKHQKDILKEFKESDVKMTLSLFKQNKIDESQYKTIKT